MSRRRGNVAEDADDDMAKESRFRHLLKPIRFVGRARGGQCAVCFAAGAPPSRCTKRNRADGE